MVIPSVSNTLVILLSWFILFTLLLRVNTHLKLLDMFSPTEWLEWGQSQALDGEQHCRDIDTVSSKKKKDL